MIRSRENRTNGYNPLPAQLFQAKDYEGGFLTASTLQYLSLKTSSFLGARHGMAVHAQNLRTHEAEGEL